MSVAIENPMFLPAMRVITVITKAKKAVVTTSFAHNYIDGLIIRLFIPEGFGMWQANQLFSPITVLSPTTFQMTIDTTNFDTFAISTTFPFDQQSAQCTPIAELTSQLTGAFKNVLPR